MIHVTCRLTAKCRNQLRNRTLGNRVWATFFYLYCQIPLHGPDATGPDPTRQSPQTLSETHTHPRGPNGLCRKPGSPTKSARARLVEFGYYSTSVVGIVTRETCAPNEQRRTLSAQSGYIAPPGPIAVAAGSARCPWNIVVDPRQGIRVLLYTFGQTRDVRVYVLSMSLSM